MGDGDAVQPFHTMKQLVCVFLDMGALATLAGSTDGTGKQNWQLARNGKQSKAVRP